MIKAGERGFVKKTVEEYYIIFTFDNLIQRVSHIFKRFFQKLDLPTTPSYGIKTKSHIYVGTNRNVETVS